MFGLLFGAILLIIGIPFVIIGQISTKRSKAAQTWPSVPGTIVRSEVVTHTDYDSEDNASTSYEPVVAYQYSVMGQEMTGSRIAYGANRFSYKKCAEICSKYPVGSQTMVHYNPEKITDTTLEVIARGGKAFTIAGIIALTIGLVAIVIGLITL